MPLTSQSAKEILKKAKAFADEVEVYVNIREQLKIDVLNGKVESLDDIAESGLSIRLIKGDKMGFAYAADIDEHSIDGTIEQAASNMSSSSADEYLHFPAPKNQSVKLTLVDPLIERTKLEDKIKLVLAIEKSAYDFDASIKKSEKISYQDIRYTTILLNSNGLDINYQKSVCGAYADIIAEKNGSMESGSWLMFSNKYNEIDPVYIGSEAAKRAVSMLGAGREKSGRAPVILSPYAATILLSAIAPAFSAEFVQKGKSAFSGAIGKPVASRKLTIIDSGILESGISTVPYDDEGVPTVETEVIKDGYLRSFLHNCYTAKKGKASSTANSFRASFRSQPEITPTNLYVMPGTKPQNEMIDGMSKGFLVTNIMGAHTINPISGDFSIGFSGFLIENGKSSKPVRGMTISGNMHELLNHVEEIGSDIMFFPHSGNIGAPSILIANLSVSGI